MSSRRFGRPAVLRGDNLAAELAAAGIADASVVDLGVRVEIGVNAELTDDQWLAVEAAVAAHTGEPTAAQRQAAADRDAARFGAAAAARARAALTDPAVADRDKDLYRLVLRAYREDNPPERVAST